eukprot:TRINITY_DN5102_c0_g1_i2.p1 TRINITY_DN5102_c0_g1~~TRINITY_DN5102_c0_g1_i2.p1  ORF type:complete len:337 (-),score=37.13 TRINITY_DN5102_c0_g1_i2:101-1111(-)
MSSNYQQMVLSMHNELRAKHGAPPLQWSRECEHKAQQQAQECQSRRCLAHGNVDGPSGRHGQNVYWCSRPEPPQVAIQNWYDEVNTTGYSFGSNNPISGTGHFTQVVWAGTREVGMAASADGTYHVANYFPAGNMMGDFARNVFPPNSKMTAPSTMPPSSHQFGGGMAGPPPHQAGGSSAVGWPSVSPAASPERMHTDHQPGVIHTSSPAGATHTGFPGHQPQWHRPAGMPMSFEHETGGGSSADRLFTRFMKQSESVPMPTHRDEEQTGKEGTCTSRSMTPFMAMLLQDCPVASIKDGVTQAFAQGSEVTVTRGPRDIEVSVKSRGGSSVQRAMW